MALGDPYVTLAQLKSWLKITNTADDTELTDALASVSTEIENQCGRQFNTDGVVSTRVFEPLGRTLVQFDDFHTLTGLIVAVDGKTWTTADYKLLPLNGLRNGRPWVYESLEPLHHGCLPCGRASVSITATWGWATVPKPIYEACLIASSETFALKDARFGVAGWGAMGDIRVRENPMVLKKLRPYLRSPILVG